MRLGPGKPPKRLEIGAIREISTGEISSTPRGKAPALKRIRDNHHNIARAFARGLRPSDVSQVFAMSISRVSVLRNDPMFNELVEFYRQEIDDGPIGIESEMRENMGEFHRLITDQLQESRETGVPIPLRTLITGFGDLADRVGYAKRSVQVNVDVSFAARLDRAIARSKTKTIEGKPEKILVLPS